MRRPAFSEVFSFVFGLWLSVAAAYAIGWNACHYARSLPAIFSAESVAGFQAVFFARTRQPYPVSGTEELLHGVRWNVRYAAASDSAATPVEVTVTAEGLPEGGTPSATAKYSFRRVLP